MAFRCRGSVGLATTGPRSRGLAAPQRNGTVPPPVPPGCEVSRMCRGIAESMLLVQKSPLVLSLIPDPAGEQARCQKTRQHWETAKVPSGHAPSYDGVVTQLREQ